jgi:site-specific recombinase XerD
MRTLMELMGHKTIETTLIYAKVSDKARANAMANI